MGKHRQRAAVRMQIRLLFMGDYFLKMPPETGTEVIYNIKHACKQPALLGQHIQEKQIQIKYDTNKIPLETGNMANK